MNSHPRPLLQLALDASSTQEAQQILEEVYPYLDLVEIGTPLIIEEGMAALETLKAKFPDKRYVADLKIMDAGRIEASSGYRRGADIVTVLAAADDQTICGTVAAAGHYGGRVMADLISVSNPELRAKELEKMGVSIICLHTPFDRPDAGEDFLCPLELLRSVVQCQLAIAGGITLDNMEAVLQKGADIVVIGGGITNHSHPRNVACEIMKKLEEWARIRR